MVKVLISVSGGRTSGYMAWWMINNRDIVAARLCVSECDLEYIFAFANTGMEHEDTLRFMYETAKNFGFHCVWLEGYIVEGKVLRGLSKTIKRGASTQYNVTNYHEAYRIEQYKDPRHPYHNHMVKYGVPNIKWKNCTREMKRNVINNWMLSHGQSEKKDFYTAIGIRADESKRCAKNPEDRNIIYPLVDWSPTDEAKVLGFWSKFSWDLKIPRESGNCVFCFEKSNNRLRDAYKLDPEAFEAIAWLEEKYGYVGPEFLRDKVAGIKSEPRPMFRQRRFASQLIQSFGV